MIVVEPGPDLPRPGVGGEAAPRKKTSGPVLTAVFERRGTLRLHAGDMAAFFQSPPPKTLADHLEAVDQIAAS
jgi:hypothetical protein